MGTDPSWSCAQTVHRLFQHMDDGRTADAAALFLPDGVWVKRGESIRGREAVQESMESRGSNVATRHVITNMVVDPADDGMKARFYVTTYADEAWSGGPGALTIPLLILVCEDRLVETAEGWRFAERTSRIAFARK